MAVNLAAFSKIAPLLLALFFTVRAVAVPAEGHEVMYAGASPYAVDVVRDIYAHGGNVVDATVAS